MQVSYWYYYEVSDTGVTFAPRKQSGTTFCKKGASTAALTRAKMASAVGLRLRLPLEAVAIELLWRPAQHVTIASRSSMGNYTPPCSMILADSEITVIAQERHAQQMASPVFRLRTTMHRVDA